MDFIDESKIYIKAGSGGKGCCSFRREKFVPKGGPDGGDGGKGGDVIIRAVRKTNTLLDQRVRPHQKAKRGIHGMGRNRAGKSGDDCIIDVPIGTIVKDLDTGEILADLKHEGQSIVAARGGHGGRGNSHFVSSINQAPTHCEPGEAGEEKTLLLELKLLADVGIVGYPNAGKSTMISRVSNARPKIADYPFTTLTPNLGVVRHREKDFVIADIPGIIDGAHEGVGLGLRFLRHIERTRILVFVVDMSPDTGRDELVELEKLQAELQQYSAELAQRKQIVVLNKCDITEGRTKAQEIIEIIKGRGYPCFMASTFSGEGLNEVLDEIVRELNDGEYQSIA